MIDLRSYFHDTYQGGEDFVENVILPIFGEDKYEDAYEEDVLENNPELTTMADSIGIAQILRLGTINIPMNPTDVFDITVCNHVQMERNRVTIQLLVRRIMSTYSSAFMVFHYNDDSRWDWRFTFCSKQGSNQETTDSKRYTFLLGPNQSCRTAAENFKKLADKHGDIELNDIVKAFDVESLSKEFFEKYKVRYGRFVAHVIGKVYIDKGEGKGEWQDKEGLSPSELFYGLGEDEKVVRDYVKKLLGRIVFLHFLQKKGWLGATDAGWTNGPQDFMFQLFNNANTDQQENFLDDILEPLFACLDTPLSQRQEVFDTKVDGLRSVRVPFLGGLFERTDEDKTLSIFPAALFADFFKFLSEYNFTIDENDPNDAQVGVDPEMLGRIFENLLEDNKDKGAFYTPKEIVQYMCRESLIAYLQTDVEDEPTREALRSFVTSHDVAVLGGKDSALARNVRQCLMDVKICDPAIGSGAFPMGLLNELFLCRGVIEDFNNAAAIKRHIIQQNIYGVDIEKGAVEIARLRFWLSLITDADTPEVLPNMDFKIMQGNSLLEQYKGFDLSHIMETKTEIHSGYQCSMFEDDLDVVRAEVKRTIQDYYNEQSHDIRSSMRQGIQQKIQRQIEIQGINVDISDVKDIAANDQFFLWHTWFSDVFEMNGGFDIVIGNPPYVQLQKIKEMSAIYKESGFKTYNKSADLYCLFVEHGFNILKKSGVLSFIMPNKWMQAAYGQQLRIFLSNKLIHNIVDFGDIQLFANATTYTCIVVLGNDKPQKSFCASYLKEFNMDTISELSHEFNTKDFGKDTWVLSSSKELILRNKLTKKFPTLKEFVGGEAYRGILSGLSEAFLITEETKDTLINTDISAKDIIEPFLLGRDMQPYASPNPNKHLILIKKGETRQLMQTEEIPSEEEAWEFMRNKYPSVMNWLEPFSVKGKKRGDKGEYWWEVRACDYYEQFSKEKIMYQVFQVKPNFIYNDTGCYCNNSMWILPTNNKALLGLLNSKMGWWLISKYCSQIQNGYQLIWKYFRQIPIALNKNSIVELVERKVNEIIESKKQHSDTTSLETEIDRLVYELYGLTNAEVKIIDPEAQVTGADNDLFKANLK